MAGRLFEAVEGISSGDDEPPVLEPSLPPLPNRALALPPPPNQALAPTRSTAVDSEAPPPSSHPDTSAQTAKAASDAKSWLKPKAQSQLDVFKSEAAARAKAIQSGKVGGCSAWAVWPWAWPWSQHKQGCKLLLAPAESANE